MNTQQIATLAAALQRGDWPDDARGDDLAQAVGRIADALAPAVSTLGVVPVRNACGVLNEHREHTHARCLGLAWQARRGFDPTVRRHTVQALVNLGAVDEAERLADEGLQLARAPDAGAQAQKEVVELQGLLGRIYKQRFVATQDLDDLAKATRQYLRQYEDLPGHPTWHGINAAALRAREEAAGSAPPGEATSAELARRVLDAAAPRYAAQPGEHWLAATISEAHLALGACDAAELWLYRFLDHPKTRPLHLDSYNRQLQEIWQGRPLGPIETCADRLAAIVQRRLEREQSRLTLSAPQLQALRADPEALEDTLEKNFRNELGFSVEDIRSMLKNCGAIACITNTTGVRLGTGFLLPGTALKASYGDAPVLVTNAHVVPDGVAPANARVSFEIESEGAGQPVSYAVGELLFTSPPGELDVSVLRVDGLAPALQPLRAAQALPLIDAKARAYVIGHPQGGGLQISLHDSQLLDVDDDERLLHYRTPTDPGSSGSPVFNAQWQVIALHHSGSSKTPRLHGSGVYEANEGIVLGAIRRALA